MPILGPAHYAVLTVLDSLPKGTPIDPLLVAWLLEMPDVEAARLLDELEALGYLVRAVGPVQ